MEAIIYVPTAVLASMPLFMYAIYAHGRLETRRKMLLGTILTLEIAGSYMKIRHRQHYNEWKKLDVDAKREKLEEEYFDKDFWAEMGFFDFVWPVVMVTAVSVIGWYLAFNHFLPAEADRSLKQAIAPTLIWGFVGAFMACMLNIIEEYHKYSLTPTLYFAVLFQLLFNSTAAFLICAVFPGENLALLAFSVGLLPVNKIWRFITNRASQLLGMSTDNSEPGEELKVIQGLEDPIARGKLVEIGITSVEALSTADPLHLFMQTTLPIRTIIDLMDKAILFLYVGDKVETLRKHGINGVIELVALVYLLEGRPAFSSGQHEHTRGIFEYFRCVDRDVLIGDIAGRLEQTPDELKAFIYNTYHDPVVTFLYDVWSRYFDGSEDER